MGHPVVHPQAPTPPDPNDRRRDLNIVPVVTTTLGRPVSSWVALSGVFTLAGGAWTVPVSISPLGVPSMADPSLPGTFKQGMNNYVAPTLGLFSTSGKHVHRRDGRHQLRLLRQRRLSDGWGAAVHQPGDDDPDRPPGRLHAVSDGRRVPRDPSTGSNPGNPLLFGAGALFFPSTPLLPAYDDGVLQLERLGTRPSSSATSSAASRARCRTPPRDRIPRPRRTSSRSR